ncbi:MAG: hypothetical protein JRC60_07335 [Deltaproteobacteria bacterium]|nr:hypothetical protein [Deltaproteobacteria bacterium]
MASVAGAIARNVGLDLMKHSDNVIIENGGDIFLKLMNRDAIVGIFAGDSPLSYNVSIRIKCNGTPAGACTSSVTAESTALADAAATAVCNRVKRAGDIKEALDFGLRVEGVEGALIIIGDKLGILGNIELA